MPTIVGSENPLPKATCQNWIAYGTGSVWRFLNPYDIELGRLAVKSREKD